jgi:hypothetical protein
MSFDAMTCRAVYAHRHEMAQFCLQHLELLNAYEARFLGALRFRADLTDGRWRIFVNVFESVRAQVPRAQVYAARQRQRAPV